MSVDAIILARGGSRGVPMKNIAPVGGVSLLGRSIRAARGAPSVTGVWVSTDHADIAAEARSWGAEVIERPADISGGTATSESGWLHALEEIRARGGAPERLVFLQCTSPFTTAEDVEATLGAMARVGAACALTVCEDHGFLWRSDGAGGVIGANHSEKEQRLRRQDMDPVWRETGAVYAVDATAFKATGNRFCGSVAHHVTEHPAVEIDTPADLALCRVIASQVPAPDTPEGLGKIRALIMDFDGVHTDDKVSVDETGRETVRASRSDGLGLGRLRAAGAVRMLILSKERNPVVTARAKKLGIEALQAIDDKEAALGSWLADAGMTWDEALFVGNDINDLPPMRAAGLSACPSDAHPSVAAEAGWILPHPGGNGALRHLCDALLNAE